jgi:hypothetical protein
MKIYSFFFIAILSVSCISTKSTIQNIDNTAVRPKVVNLRFLLTEYATDHKYGFDADYPINIGIVNENYEDGQIGFFFNALESVKGERVLFEKTDTCCPFPTKNNTMGAGTLSIYEYNFEGTSIKGKLYFNVHEKGKILCPKGFSIKK